MTKMDAEVNRVKQKFLVRIKHGLSHETGEMSLERDFIFTQIHTQIQQATIMNVQSASVSAIEENLIAMQRVIIKRRSLNASSLNNLGSSVTDLISCAYKFKESIDEVRYLACTENS